MTHDDRTIKKSFINFEHYLKEGLVPLWASSGWDEAQGRCYEKLSFQSKEPLTLSVRLLVIARNLFVFSWASHLWGNDDYATKAHQLYQFLITNFWDDDYGGWFFQLDGEAHPEKVEKDLYGHAFVLFALAHYYQVFHKKEALKWAQKTDACLQNFWRSDGFYGAKSQRDWQAVSSRLAQNPHMHLLEAYQALFTADEENPRWTAGVKRVMDIFKYKLWDDNAGVLREYTDSLGQPDLEKGDIVEAGHHFEWAWLLSNVKDGCTTSFIDRLMSWGEQNGIDYIKGGIFNQVNGHGQILDNHKRIWPVTEYLKALACRHEKTQDAASFEKLGFWLKFLQEVYLCPDGRWHEHLDIDLKPQEGNTLPATTSYHLLMAYKVMRPIFLKTLLK